MPLSSIVVIVIRLFALNWLFTAVPLLLSAAATPLPHERRLSVVLTPYAPGGLLLIFAAGLWILTPAIARLVSRGVDTSVSHRQSFALRSLQLCLRVLGPVFHAVLVRRCHQLDSLSCDRFPAGPHPRPALSLPAYASMFDVCCRINFIAWCAALDQEARIPRPIIALERTAARCAFTFSHD